MILAMGLLMDKRIISFTRWFCGTEWTEIIMLVRTTVPRMVQGQ